jgi:heme oxygenase
MSGAETSPVAYAHVLCDLYEIFGSLEPIAEAAVAGETGSTPMILRRRLLLLEDLKHLGAKVPIPRPAITRIQNQLGSAPLPTRLGLAYVLVGQSLGTAVILKSLTRDPMELMCNTAPDLARDVQAHKADQVDSTKRGETGDSAGVALRAPFSFFSGLGRDTPTQWALFLKALDEAAPAKSITAREQALAGANLGFEAFLALWRDSRI